MNGEKPPPHTRSGATIRPSLSSPGLSRRFLSELTHFDKWPPNIRHFVSQRFHELQSRSWKFCLQREENPLWRPANRWRNRIVHQRYFETCVDSEVPVVVMGNGCGGGVIKNPLCVPFSEERGWSLAVVSGRERDGGSEGDPDSRRLDSSGVT
ncbi:hypothetical protein E2C01_053437 [Portunus trituberculatus]|uniref:Uncharacterized protein n=1 Tax=Portunus trituberculatus TaxID=210409 RepID=A0A5B7GQT1_PORTR|nr:hypothetical protein [Portunus trituberculatus]